MVDPFQEFSCAFCASTIDASDPRIRCLVCEVACDMCANCVLGERFKGPHLGTHEVQVIKQSGYKSDGGERIDEDGRILTVLGRTAISYYPPQPVPRLPVACEERANNGNDSASARNLVIGQGEIQYDRTIAPPCIQSVAVAAVDQQQLQDAVASFFAQDQADHSANHAESSSLHSVSQQDNRTFSVSVSTPIYQNASPVSSPPAGPGHSNPPPVPPRRPTATRPTSHGSSRPIPTTNFQQQSSSGPTVTGWQPFFLSDMSPSPTFLTLINDAFTYLDRQNLGNLEPDVFSGFLDDLGIMAHENAWKINLKATYGLSAESMADKALKSVFDLFSIDHVLLKRIQPPHQDPTSVTAHYKRILGSAFNPAMLQQASSAYSTIEGPMPGITRKGFADIMVHNAKCMPSRDWGNWCRLVRKYQLPRYAGWGDIPRECFLEYPDPLTLQRVDEMMRMAEREGQQKLAASRAALQIAAQGRRNAAELLGNGRYVYR